jgi:hypothetical protein
VIGGPAASTLHTVASPQDRKIIAACQQVGCERYHYGWDTVINPATELGRMQIQLVLNGRHGRTYRDLGVNADGMRVFRFEAHQRCFEEHRTRPELYVVRAAGLDGDDLGLIRRHTRAIDFAEDLQETQGRRIDSKQKG